MVEPCSTSEASTTAKATSNHPRHEADLCPREAQRLQAQRHGQGPRHEHQRQGHGQRGQPVLEQAAGGDEQAQQQEHQRLRQPGEAVHAG
jgi:site-specific DNA-cytosine methylase